MESPKTYGQEGINKKISELKRQKEVLVKERDSINSKIKILDLEIKKWEVEISPNQTKLF
jgi:hypothetical protein